MTRHFATYTSRTEIPICSAVWLGEKFSCIVSRYASQVSRLTRGFTKLSACCSWCFNDSSSLKASSLDSSSVEARYFDSRAAAMDSPLRHSRRAVRFQSSVRIVLSVTTFSQHRKLPLFASKLPDRSDVTILNSTSCVTSRTSASCRPNRRHHAAIRGSQPATSVSQSISPDVPDIVVSIEWLIRSLRRGNSLESSGKLYS